MKQYYSDCIVEYYRRYAKQQIDEIYKLKTNAAEERRKADIIIKCCFVKELFTKQHLLNCGHLEDIDNICNQVID